MSNFIKLTKRHGENKININTANIDTFESFHNEGKGWEFSVLYINGIKVEVKENEKEIQQKISKQKESADYDKVFTKLECHLRAGYGYRGDPMFNDEDPEYDNIGGMGLYYDEGNEEIRVTDGTFWSELPTTVQHYILDKWME